MSVDLAATLVVAIPLLSAGVLLLLGRRSDGFGHWLGVAASAASCVLSVLLLLSLLGSPAEDRSGGVQLFSWIPVVELSDDAGFLVAPLSLTFLILFTSGGTLIHLYAASYMAYDAARRRFFASLTLFVVALLILVLTVSCAL